MSNFEILTLLVALLAVVPGLIALVRQSRQRKRMDQLEDAQLRQNRATAALHEKQLEMLVASERSQNGAHVKLELLRNGSSYRFRVSNLGPAAARNVEVKFLTEDGGHNPAVDGDYKAKFPASVLDVGSSIEFLAAIYLDSPSSYNATVSWTDPNGSRIENAAYVAI